MVNIVVYTQRIRVRYGECDIQGVVFNANYLLYVDDVIDTWLSATLEPDALDYMVKKALLDWDSPARRGEILDLTGSVSRWGNTSFDFTVRGEVAGRAVFTATLTCVSVTPGTHTPTPVSDDVRKALSS
jgi:acyl-CoA thioester hydrolase